MNTLQFVYKLIKFTYCRNRYYSHYHRLVPERIYTNIESWYEKYHSWKNRPRLYGYGKSYLSWVESHFQLDKPLKYIFLIVSIPYLYSKPSQELTIRQWSSIKTLPQQLVCQLTSCYLLRVPKRTAGYNTEDYQQLKITN